MGVVLEGIALGAAGGGALGATAGGIGGKLMECRMGEAAAGVAKGSAIAGGVTGAAVGADCGGLGSAVMGIFHMGNHDIQDIDDDLEQ